MAKGVFKSSKDVVTKGVFLSGLVQSLSKVKLLNIVTKLVIKHAILTTLVNSSLNNFVQQTSAIDE